MWLCLESQKWIITNAAGGITHTLLCHHHYQNYAGMVNLNFHSNRIITKNTVSITVDLLIKVIYAM